MASRPRDQHPPSELATTQSNQISTDIRRENNKDSRSEINTSQRDKKAKYLKHLERQFDGSSGRRFPYTFNKPHRKVNEDDVENVDFDPIDKEGIDWKGRRRFIDTYGNDRWKYEDVDTYLSTTLYVPKRLMVQATKQVRQAGLPDTWRQSKIKGNPPTALRMAEWALGSKWHRYWRLPLVALPLQFFLALPGVEIPWGKGEVEDTYTEYPGNHWFWPKHSINPLDMRGGKPEKPREPKNIVNMLSTRQRLQRPRNLVIYQDGKWETQPNPPRDLQYVFISWVWTSFESKDGSGKAKLRQMAEAVTRDAGLQAYWLDQDCNAKKEDKQLLTADVNRMSDVIRGSKFVALLIADSGPQWKANWGRRLWCLPEGLLAPGRIRVCTWQDGGDYKKRDLSKVELCSEFWTEVDGNTPARLLAEHYDQGISLSRLELFSVATQALATRETSNNYTGADHAYALMGLLNHRIEPDKTDDLFQVVARLSLANDNDQLIERMIAMFPKPTSNINDLFETFAEEDQYATHFWDIHPRCNVVGIGDEPNTVIIDDVRAIPIRWKQFPRIKCKSNDGLRNTLAEYFVRSGLFWFAAGWGLLVTYAPILAVSADDPGSTSDASGSSFGDSLIPGLAVVVGIMFAIGFILSFFAPASVLRLLGGVAVEAAPQIIGFEGVMPIKKLERIIFGNCRDRLGYDPSSTPYNIDYRDPKVRKGSEPLWVTEKRPEDAVPKVMTESGYRLFTLVDINNSSVSIFQARHPPTVALLCGSEGGMLRAVLCSWRFANDCLYKESVIRVPTRTWYYALPTEWLKIALESQSDTFNPHLSKSYKDEREQRARRDV